MDDADEDTKRAAKEDAEANFIEVIFRLFESRLRMLLNTETTVLGTAWPRGWGAEGRGLEREMAKGEIGVMAVVLVAMMWVDLSEEGRRMTEWQSEIALKEAIRLAVENAAEVGERLAEWVEVLCGIGGIDG